jgi:hypothetical protein
MLCADSDDAARTTATSGARRKRKLIGGFSGVGDTGGDIP